jgi:hypothetical protein
MPCLTHTLNTCDWVKPIANGWQRTANYSSIISQKTIRGATNKAWVLGNEQFKAQVQSQLERRVEPSAKGGDRKSAAFKINQV